MTAITISALRQTAPARYVFPALVVVLPILIYFGIGDLVFTRMTPAAQALNLDFWTPEHEGSALGIFGADLAARYTFGLATSAFILCALAALALVVWRLAPRWGVWAALAVIAAALIVGVAYTYTPLHSLRLLVSQSVLSRIAELKLTNPATTPAHIIDIIRLSQGIGVAALCAMAVRFADLAFEPSSAAQTEDSLRERMAGFRNALLVSGLMLAFAVASSHAFYHYPAALMIEDSAREFGVLASTAATFWGAIYSGVLLAVALPCYAAIIGDAAAVSAEKGGETHASRAEWLESEGLTLAPRQAFVSLLATAAPLLTAPALDLLTALPV